MGFFHCRIEDDVKMKGAKILVLGTGVSGIGSAELLKDIGAFPYLFDENEQALAEAIRMKLREAYRDIPIYIGSMDDGILKETKLAIISPGVPIDAPFVLKMKKMGIKVSGEIELAYLLSKGSLVAITGTNGKTTTTTLTGEIMKTVADTHVVGNIGYPYTIEALKTNDESVTVAEISSFQLETMETFHPHVSAILNITPDHLNRHHTMENYIALKESVTKCQTKDDFCILNYRDEVLRDFARECPARVLFFSSVGPVEDGMYLEGEQIYRAYPGREPVPMLSIHDMNLVGMCNYENVMAAFLITEAMGVPKDNILKTIRDFKAVEHRIEFVAEKKGVVYYNDSKATNPDAAIQGIKAMTRPTVLIGGGFDKNNTYDEWIEAFDGKVKALVLIGQTREAIAECAQKHGIQNVILADTYEECFKICVEQAEKGDAVLLSPACASWGMFKCYEQRGTMFKDMVNALED